MSPSEHLRVVGFVVCAAPTCENLVLEGISYKTGGLCEPCCRDGLREQLSEVQIAAGSGRVFRSLAKPAKTRRNRAQYERRKANQARRARIKAIDKAKLAAMKRLRAAAPELYDLILADERYKRGLSPFPVETTSKPGSGIVGWETLDALAFYHALTDPGEPHVAEVPIAQPLDDDCGAPQRPQRDAGGPAGQHRQPTGPALRPDAGALHEDP